MSFISGLTASSLLASMALASALSIPDIAESSAMGVLEILLRQVTTTGSKGKLSTRGDTSVPLTNFREIFYYADITIGSQNQTAEVVIDTGSSDLVLGNSSYNPAHSSTSKNLHQNATAWGSVTELYTDTVGIGEFSVPNVELGISDRPFSLLGLGPISAEQAPTFQNFPFALADAGLISKAAFSVYLQNEQANENTLVQGLTNGVVFFGGIDHAKYEGNLVSHPIESTLAAIKLDSIKFADGSSYSVSLPAAIDTGTTSALFPSALNAKIRNIFGPVTANKTIINYKESWADDVFEFNFGSSKIEVPYTDFLDEVGDNEWTIAPLYDSDEIILGDLIVRNIYSVFDYSANTILIAQAAKNAYNSTNITVIT